MRLDELQKAPTSEQILRWQETEGHTNEWLARHLGIEAVAVKHGLVVGFDDEVLETIADLMTHPREIFGE